MQEATNQSQINVDLPQTTSLQFLSQKNQAVNWGQFYGNTRLVYFGYTNCPDICPTGLYKISQALNIVENRNVFLPIFISVDPTHDTPEFLDGYLGYFDSRIIGLTGSEKNLQQLAKIFMVYYQKHSFDEGHYVFDHPSGFYLVSSSGEILDILESELSAEELVSRIYKSIDQSI